MGYRTKGEGGTSSWRNTRRERSLSSPNLFRRRFCEQNRQKTAWELALRAIMACSRLFFEPGPFDFCAAGQTAFRRGFFGFLTVSFAALFKRSTGLAW